MATRDRSERTGGIERVARQRAAPIGKRVRAWRGARECRAQRERLEEDRLALAAEGEEGGETRQRQRALKRAQGRLEARELRLKARDEEAVRGALERGEPIEAVVSLEGATELDEVLWMVLERMELGPALEALKPEPTYENQQGEVIERRRMYPALVLNLLVLMSRSAGLSSGPAVQAVLLADEGWMGLLGFKVQEVRQGTTQRSEGLRGQTRGEGHRFEEAGPAGPARARVEGPRGALSSQTLAAHEGAVTAEAVTELFNAVVRAMVRLGLVGRKVRGVIDTTLLEEVPSFEGAGEARRKVKVMSKARRPRQVEVKLRGFKLWYLMDADSGLPLAMVLDTIEKPENERVRELVNQAKANLGRRSRLEGVAVDRGFLDGDLRWWLAQQGLYWVCPAKNGMLVTAEARQRVAQALCQGAKAGEEPLSTARRLARSGRRAAGAKFFVRADPRGQETLVVAEVNDLTCTDFYGEGGADSSRVHRKSFVPTPLHATVVLSWPQRSAADRADEQEHEAEPDEHRPLVLLSPVAESALARFDRYDERSLIENRLHRDGKQYFGLGAALARNRASLWTAAVWSTVALMVHRALDPERQARADAEDPRAESLGLKRYRRQVMLRNRNKVLVIAGGYCAVLWLSELVSLLRGEV